MKKLIFALLALMLLVGWAAAEECRHTYWSDELPLKEGWYIKEGGGLEYRVTYQTVCYHCGEKGQKVVVIPDDQVPQGGVQTCPHDVWVTDALRASDMDWAREISADTTGFISAVCTLCNDRYLFYEGGDEDVTCSGRYHIYKLESEILEEGWYKSSYTLIGDGSIGTHAYQTYYRAKCLCGAEERKCYLYGKYADGTRMDEEHILIEVASYHTRDSYTSINQSTTHVRVMKCVVCGYTFGYNEPCNLYLNGLCSVEMKEAWEFYDSEE